MKFINYLITAVMALCPVVAVAVPSSSDSIPDGFSLPLQSRFGVETTPSYVPMSNPFLKGSNARSQPIKFGLGSSLRWSFSFDPQSRQGQLYHGLYQGIGIDCSVFDHAGDLLGSPISVYVMQGAPIVYFGRFSLDYEWQFGATFGWKHYKRFHHEDNLAFSTSVTARMNVGFKMRYYMSRRWDMTFGVGATHFSNGNTSLPNMGVNMLGISIGASYSLSPRPENSNAGKSLANEADSGRWFFDIVGYGSWRRRAVYTDGFMQICPGKFGVAGLQIAPMRGFNRWLAAGLSLDMQYDESAGLSHYWVEGTSGESIKFFRPPFGKQLSIGTSAHAELTAPLFSVNIGLGYDFLKPEGDKRFYQSLTLKTFILKNFFLNVGYRLGNFHDPQNLMLGLGVRI